MNMKTMQRIFWILFSIVAVIVTVGAAIEAWVLFKLASVIQTDGLKSLVDTIWLGNK